MKEKDDIKHKQTYQMKLKQRYHKRLFFLQSTQVQSVSILPSMYKKALRNGF